MEAKRVKLSKIRQYIGNKLNQSKNEQPHVMGCARMDMTPLLELSEKLRNDGKKVTMTSFFLKIFTIVLKEIPELNTTLDGDEVLYHNSINPGIAFEDDKGLKVLVLKDIQDKNLFEIDAAFRDLISRVKTNKITMDDMTGSTFTFSNCGKSNMQIYTSIINNTEGMLTGLGGIYKEAVVLDDGTIAPRDVAYMTCNYNHRIMDGGPAMKYLARLDEILKDPAKYLL